MIFSVTLLINIQFISSLILFPPSYYLFSSISLPVGLKVYVLLASFLDIFIFYFTSVFTRHTHTHTERERERESSHRQREKQDPCREHDAGLDPGTPGSCPEPKADAQCIAAINIGVQVSWFFTASLSLG